MSSFEIIGSAVESFAVEEPQQVVVPQEPLQRIPKAEKSKPSPPSPDSQKIIDKLTKYKNHPHFSKCLKQYDLNPKAMSKMDSDDLYDLNVSVMACINASLSSGIMNSTVYGCVSIFEYATENKLNLKGLTEALKEDEEFTLALDQMAIEHGDLLNMPPHYRMMFSLVRTIGLLRLKNGPPPRPLVVEVPDAERRGGASKVEVKETKVLVEEEPKEPPAVEPQEEAQRRLPTGFPKKQEGKIDLPRVGVRFS